MKLEGSLDAFGLPDVLHLLHATAKTGALHVVRDHRSASIYLVEGQVAGAVSSASGRLGLLRRLVAQGLVTEDMVGQAAAEASESGSGLVATMVAVGCLESEIAQAQTHALTLDTLFELLRWEDGDFSFSAEELPGDDVGVREAPGALVALAVARVPEWDAAAAHVPSPEHVPVLARGIDGAQTLSEAEWEVLTLIDGHRCVHDLVSASGIGSYALVVRLAGLVERGCVHVWPDRAAAQAHTDGRTDILGMLDAAEGLTSLPSDPELASPSAPDQPSDELGDAEREQPEGPRTTVVTVADRASTTARPADPASTPRESSGGSRSDALPKGSQSTLGGGALLGGAHVPGDVTPPRPEPFLPPRAPEHVESIPLGPAERATSDGGMQVIGANAVIAAPAPDIDSLDASPTGPTSVPLNRSMVLRLIAGVRGL